MHLKLKYPVLMLKEAEVLDLAHIHLNTIRILIKTVGIRGMSLHPRSTDLKIKTKMRLLLKMAMHLL
jgi:hypothetical protein